MKSRYILVGLSLLLVTCIFLANFLLTSENTRPKTFPDFYVGVDAAYDDVDEIKRLIDEISKYTNLFIIGSTGITYNETKLTDLCQYIFDKELSFIVFTNDHDYPISPSTEWIDQAKADWGERFRGLYVFDEVGGKNVDSYIYRLVKDAENITDASSKYVTHLEFMLREVAPKLSLIHI